MTETQTVTLFGGPLDGLTSNYYGGDKLVFTVRGIGRCTYELVSDGKAEFVKPEQPK